VMVPVICCKHAAACCTSTATSSAMLLPRATLSSQSGADQHEPCSAGNCHELNMLGMCHEGPTTRASHGEARSPKHPGERAREDQERQGRHREARRGTGFLEQNQQVQKLYYLTIIRYNLTI
jgi:hypothetical protein